MRGQYRNSPVHFKWQIKHESIIILANWIVLNNPKAAAGEGRPISLERLRRVIAAFNQFPGVRDSITINIKLYSL